LPAAVLDLWIIMIETIRRTVAESLELKRTFFQANGENIAVLAQAVCTALERGNKILLCGNGGSAADAQHIAAEFVGRFQRDRQPLAAIALTTDTSVLTSVGNDYGYDQVFARQVRALGRTGDISIAISTSGNSANILLGTAAAREAGMVTAGFTGGDGGRLGGMVDHHLHVPHRLAARVQEVHIMLGHLICELVDRNLKGS
jgi:D-sedoheptulose 7-phosphate isomerase